MASLVKELKSNLTIRQMIYGNKINWADPNKAGDALAYSQSKFKTAVLDYQVAVEGELGDIIKRTPPGS